MPLSLKKSNILIYATVYINFENMEVFKHGKALKEKYYDTIYMTFLE